MSGKRRAPARSPEELGRRRDSAQGSSLPASPPIHRRQAVHRLVAHPPNSDDAFVAPPRSQQLHIPKQHQSAKVAIPRLSRDVDASSSSPADKVRVSHACEPCRQRKTKCSGERPVCRHCEEFQYSCFYADGKRERTKKEIGNMAGKIEDYERLLRDLSLRTSDEDQSLIHRALNKEGGADADDVLSESSFRKSQSDTAVEGPQELAGEHRVSARVGSTGSLDNINEDYNRSTASRATGFLGKNSEVVWMQRLNRWVNEPSDGIRSPEGNQLMEHGVRPTSEQATGLGATNDQSTSDSTYHCDDLPVIVTDQVDPFELPPKNVADRLFQSYFDTVHPAFPILGKSTFVSQYQTFNHRQALNTGNNWRAILNVIFAIAAKYSHLIQAEWRGDERDHLVYFTRARMLGFDGESILAHPELQHIQVAGLIAFYLMTINQVSRAWAMSGIAIRQAITLGLNLQNASKDVHKASREIRYRLWWALCSTERTLSVMTGRPTSFSETDCSVPLPLHADEETLFKEQPRFTSHATLPAMRHSSTQSSKDRGLSASSASIPDNLIDGSDLSKQQDSKPSVAMSANDASCFLFNVKLSILTSNVMAGLYRAGTSNETWAQVQSKITGFNSKLLEWFQELPAAFDFTEQQGDPKFLRHRLYLGFAYYSTKTMINRPALCRIDHKIPSESEKAKDFNRSTAARCVHSAKAVLEMLPTVPNAVALYQVAPWWCLVHHLVQASTVLMLELSFRADHMPNEAEEILEAAKKAVRWLRAMSEENVAARRAWKLCDGMLRKVAPKIGRTVDDIPAALDELDQHGRAAFDVEPDHGLAIPGVAAQGGHDVFHMDSQLEEHTFHPQAYTSYDEFMASSMSAPEASSTPFGTMFPSAAQMNALGSRAFESDSEGYPNRQPHWNVEANDSRGSPHFF